MNRHCRLVLILGIAYSLLSLPSNTAQTKIKSADEARAAQISERNERGLPSERSLDSSPRFNLHFNPLASPALSEPGWTKSLAISPQHGQHDLRHRVLLERVARQFRLW